MIKRLSHKVIVDIKDIKPSKEGYQVIGVFNPSAVLYKDQVYLLIRVAERPAEQKEGYFSSPAAQFNGKGFETLDQWIPIIKDNGDKRQFKDKKQLMRLSFISHLRLVKMERNGFDIAHIDQKPSFYPENELEEYGVEDPRMTPVNGRFYFTYVAVSRKMGVATALASTSDFKEYTRHGFIFCLENKDVVLLPEKIKNRYVCYHRPVGACRLRPPAMQIAYSPDLIHWGEHAPLLEPRDGYWDAERIGAGPPPIKTSAGWLEIYHGVKIENEKDSVGVYRAGAALFDIDDPSKLIARSPEPILSPEEGHETQGFVNNVFFPTGLIMDEDGESVILYSGGADTVVTATKVSLKDILNSLEYV